LGIRFKSRDVAPLFILPGFLIFTAVIWIYVQRRTWPWLRACRRKISFLGIVVGALTFTNGSAKRGALFYWITDHFPMLPEGS